MRNCGVSPQMIERLALSRRVNKAAHLLLNPAGRFSALFFSSDLESDKNLNIMLSPDGAQLVATEGLNVVLLGLGR